MNGNSTFVENVRILMVKGETGSSIQSITKTGTSGAVDTYTITMTDGSTSTFTVTNGTPIQSIVLTSSDDEYDYYTLTDSAGNTSTFKVQNHDKDMTDFEAEINALLDNTPYLYYVEDGDFELPVNTINDTVSALDSTWSSSKINSELSAISDEVNNSLTYKVGDTITGQKFSMYLAWTSDSGRTLNFTIPVAKPIKNDVTGVAFSNTTNMLLKSEDGTGISSGMVNTIADVTVRGITGLGIALTLTKKSGTWSGNGLLMVVMFDQSFSMTFTGD